MMVELDVRQHGDLHAQAEHRAVRLVGLDDQPLAAAPLRVGQATSHRSADQPSRLHPGGGERVDEHRGGGRLAVGAGDRDGAPERRQLTQQLRARKLGDAALARGDALDVLRAHRG